MRPVHSFCPHIQLAQEPHASVDPSSHTPLALPPVCRTTSSDAITFHPFTRAAHILQAARRQAHPGTPTPRRRRRHQQRQAIGRAACRGADNRDPLSRTAVATNSDSREGEPPAAGTRHDPATGRRAKHTAVTTNSDSREGEPPAARGTIRQPADGRSTPPSPPTAIAEKASRLPRGEATDERGR
jgi:hypothetical protein